MIIKRICLFCKKEFDCKRKDKRCCTKKCTTNLFLFDNPKLKTEYRKKYYKTHKDIILNKQKIYNIKVKEKRHKREKAYYEIHKEHIKLKSRLYYSKNKEDIKIKQKEYNSKTKEQRRLYLKEYEKKKRQEDPIWTLKYILRRRICSYLKSNNFTKKINSTFSYIGCSPEELKKHLEKQFTLGMNWNNYGWGWHIDHKIPLASAKNKEQALKLCHYTNLQPLWALDNLKKGGR